MNLNLIRLSRNKKDGTPSWLFVNGNDYEYKVSFEDKFDTRGAATIQNFAIVKELFLPFGKKTDHKTKRSWAFINNKDISNISQRMIFHHAKVIFSQF